MEVAGLAIGVVGVLGLFNTCVDAIGRLDSYNDFGEEYGSISAQLQADKVMLERWGKATGFNQTTLLADHDKSLDDPRTLAAVTDILSSIHQLCETVDGTGPKKKATTDDRLKAEEPLSMRKRMIWVLRSKTRFVSKVQQLGELVQRLYSLVPTQLSGPETQSPALTLPHDLKKVLLEIQEKNHRELSDKFREWLGASETADVYDQAVRRRLDKTCDWIFECQPFREWLSPDFPEGSAKALWINGPAGYGKTTLCAWVVSHFKTTSSPFASFFMSSRSGRQSDPFAIVRSWLFQIVSKNDEAFRLACDKWEEHEGGLATPSAVVEILSMVLEKTPGCTLIVDGLDECSWPKHDWRRDDRDYNSPRGFFTSIAEFAARRMARILLVSRDDTEIREAYSFAISCDENIAASQHSISSDDVRSDAAALSQHIVDEKLSNKNAGYRAEVSQRILTRSDGMFLWMKMLEPELDGGISKKKLLQVIDQTPTDINELYGRNWARISSQSVSKRRRAFAILRWVTFSHRPITVRELTEALLIHDHDEECSEEEECEGGLDDDELPDAIDKEFITSRILEICGSLVETRIVKQPTNDDDSDRTDDSSNNESSTVHLVHFSVSEFLKSQLPVAEWVLRANGKLARSHVTAQTIHLMSLCLRYLDLESVWDTPLEFEDHSDPRKFTEFAVSFVFVGVPRQEETLAWPQIINDLTNRLFGPRNQRWVELCRTLSDLFPGERPLRLRLPDYASLGDVSGSVKDQVQAAEDSPLFYAARLGLTGTVLHLLAQPGSVVDQAGRRGRTALHGACAANNPELVRILLEKGANIERDNDYLQSPLWIACTNDDDPEVAILLLQHGADTSARRRGESLLCTAIQLGHFEVSKALVNYGADFSPGGFGHGAFGYATYGAWHPADLELAKLLLDKGADVDHRDGYGRTPLIGALRCYIDNRHDVIKLLINSGADVCAADSSDRTVLREAILGTVLSDDEESYKKDEELVALLLDKGADSTLDYPDDDGATPLMHAVSQDWAHLVNLLLDRGAAINARDNEGQTALIWATTSQRFHLVELLLDRGADIAICDEDGFTALGQALRRPSLSIIQLLLNRGASIHDKCCGDERRPLHFAVRRHHTDVAELLINKGVNIEAKNMVGYTALLDAVLDNNERAVSFLLERGADINSKDHSGQTPLIGATRNGIDTMVKFLLLNGADTERKTLRVGETALHIAALRSHAGIAGELLSHPGTDHTAKESCGRTVLSLAAFRGSEEIVKLALDAGGGPHSRSRVHPLDPDLFGLTSLALAVLHGWIRVVQLLLQAIDGPFDVRDNFGRSLLWWTGRTGNKDMANLLREEAARRGVALLTPAVAPATLLPSQDRSCGLRLSKSRCTVCLLDMVDTAYRCLSFCPFFICPECRLVGARCHFSEGHGGKELLPVLIRRPKTPPKRGPRQDGPKKVRWADELAHDDEKWSDVCGCGSGRRYHRRVVKEGHFQISNTIPEGGR